MNTDEVPPTSGLLIDWETAITNPHEFLAIHTERLRADKLLHEYARRCPSESEMKDGPRKTVTDIIARRAFWSLVLADKDNIDLGHPERDLAALCVMTENAVPYLWDALLFEMTSIGEMPPHQVGKQLPFKHMWLTFDRNIQLPRYAATTEAILLIEADNCLMGVSFGINDENKTCVGKITNLPYGTPYDEAPSPWPELICALSFMESPYVVISETGLNRRERRNSGRGPVKESDIHEVARFITLRKADYETGDLTGNASREWKHRWLVRCHRRKQWYPSLQGHKIIWVKAHVKGPDDAPFKSTAYKVDR